MARLSLYFLGPFQATLDGHPLKGFESNKVRALLAYLAVESDRPHSRESLAALLWPNYLNRSAVNNLRSVLANLRDVLGDRTATPPYLMITRDAIRFNPAADYELDVDTFSIVCGRALADLPELLTVYRGDFLAGFCLPDNLQFEEWLLTRREHLRQRMLDALDKLATEAERRAAYSDAVVFARRQLEMDNLCESAHRQLMLALAHLGQRTEALAQYELCAQLLRVELDIEPSAETRALAQRISAEEIDSLEAALATSTPTGKSEPRHNLPLQLSSFIGREREIAEVQRLLAASRLVTLTGAGGCGKSRLGLEVAAGRLPEHPGGTWLIELAPLSNPDLALGTVASTIGLRDQSGRPIQEALIDYLRPWNALLLLDNCEHLIATCAALAETLLRACPRLHILATSREPLAISGETVYMVPSLQVPETGKRAGEMAGVESVRLFVERAEAQAGFALTDGNAAEVGQICRRLDGIPLAIELAAARVRAISPSQISEHLDDRFQLLTSGVRTALPRQQTLQATIDWSYNLLTEPEKTLFRRLAVFRGGWTLEAAEAVCAGPDLTGFENLLGLDVLDLLGHLVDKSLVMAKETGGIVRYSRLETIRQYGCEKLEASGELEQMRRRHLDYFLDFAERGNRELRGPRSLEWTRRMDADHNNLRAALEYAFSEQGASDPVVRLSRAVGGFNGVWSTGSFKEGHYWIEKAMAHPDALPSTALRARLLFHSAVFDDHCPWEKQRSRFEESLAIFDGLGEAYSVERAYLLMWLGFKLCYQLGERERGNRYMQEALRIFEDSGEKWALGFALNLCSGVIIDLDNDFNAAWSLNERGMEIAQQTGEQFLIAVFNDNFGYINVRHGRYSEGQEYLEKSLEVHRQFQTLVFACQTLKWLGDAARGLNDYERAEACYRESLAMVQDIGWLSYQAVVYLYLGTTLLHRNDVEQAIAYFKSALDLSLQHTFRFIAYFVLDCLAAACAVLPKPHVAAQLFGAFDAQLDALLAEGYTRHRIFDAIDVETHDHFLSLARTQLDEAIFEQRWQEGRALTQDEAIKLALATIGT